MNHYFVFDSHKKIDFNAVVDEMKCFGVTYFIASSGTEVIFVRDKHEVPHFLARKQKWLECCHDLSRDADWYRFDFDSRIDFNVFRQMLFASKVKHFFYPWGNSLLIPCYGSSFQSCIKNNDVYMSVCTQVVKQERVEV